MPLTIHGPAGASTLDVLVDTGFDGSLLLPHSTAVHLGLQLVTSTQGALADGTMVRLDIASADLDWLNGRRKVFVYVTAAPEALLGTSLLDPHRLLIDYTAGVVKVS